MLGLFLLLPLPLQLISCNVCCLNSEELEKEATYVQLGHRRLVSFWGQNRRLRRRTIRPPRQRAGARLTTCTGGFSIILILSDEC